MYAGIETVVEIIRSASELKILNFKHKKVQKFAKRTDLDIWHHATLYNPNN